VSVVARQYDVNANQVFNWRKRYRDDRHAPVVTSAPQLIPVMVTAEQGAAAALPSTVAGTIEIDLAGKYRVRINPHIESETIVSQPIGVRNTVASGRRPHSSEQHT
jgi:transposase